MRRLVGFDCEGAALVGALDDADGRHGLLIVTGGSDTRWGSHRLFERLAHALAARGISVFRFDRRGIGDSDGDDPGYAASGPDIAAALAEFRRLCPQLDAVTGFGLCDGATALVLAAPALDGLLLANPWLVEPRDDLPPATAIRRRYRERLASPSAWRRALTGRIDYAKAARGIARLAQRESGSLGKRVVAALAGRQALAIVAIGDATAQAALPFLEGKVTVTRIDTASHSFAGEEAFAALVETVAGALI
jgi:exosortase A-associated hydrolase 1